MVMLMPEWDKYAEFGDEGLIGPKKNAPRWAREAIEAYLKEQNIPQDQAEIIVE